MNPVINGLVTAMSLSQMFQRMSLEREAIERQKKRDERNDQLQDLQTELSLASNPYLEELAPGQTTREVTANAGLPTEIFGTSTITGQMPVDRTLEHKGKKYAVRSRNEVAGEQFRNKVAQDQAEINMRNAADLNRIFAQHQGNLEIEGLRQSAADARQVGELTARKDMNDADNRAAAERLKQELQGRKDIEGLQQAGADRRNNADNATSRANAQLNAATREEIAAGRGGTNDKAARVELQKLEAEEYGVNGKPGLHREMLEIGNQLTTGRIVDRDGEERKLTDQEKTTLRNKLKILETRRSQILKRKQELGFTGGGAAKNDPLGVRKNDPAKVR